MAKLRTRGRRLKGSEAAAIHFDITEEEASEIYINKAVEEGESYKVEY
ncbi:hypothetical protein F3K44_31650 [Bacillus megaterium]|nr:hypothetical protein [Priestia megaterium]